jgi:hypothetical protein
VDFLFFLLLHKYQNMKFWATPKVEDSWGRPSSPDSQIRNIFPPQKRKKKKWPQPNTQNKTSVPRNLYCRDRASGNRAWTATENPPHLAKKKPDIADSNLYHLRKVIPSWVDRGFIFLCANQLYYQ